ncbi:TonB-dependent receptor [Parabacteroides sp. OttesenSCG-928-G21]|nr:TonB-dependent receptor [Parabacteroides sp. OttesenSCG-928-G21]
MIHFGARGLLLLLFLSLSMVKLTAQERRVTLSGMMTDSDSGESLIGATVLVKDTRTGAVSNTYGFYSISLQPGIYTFTFSYVGFSPFETTVDLVADKRLDVKLSPEAGQLSEVVVTAAGRNANVARLEMGTERLSVKEIKTIPALMGEVDVIKAVQLLPGVQSTSEASSGFSVRGGSHDQNLILLDEATVYNASHLMGFFSVFNNDAIKEVTLYKGDIPATFGGRLSSLLDIRSKEGNNQRFTGTGGIGLISSRLTLEGPLGSDKISYLISGRRTYADLFLKLASDKDLRQSTLYFYDLNGKINWRINDNNRIYLSAYLGQDEFGVRFAGMGFGNKTLSARWNHIFSPKLFSNFTLIGSFYDYSIDMDLNEQLNQEWDSNMRDWGAKADFSYHLNPQNHIRFGYNFLYHSFIPGEGGGRGEDAILGRFSIPREYAMEHALYLSNEQSIGEKLKIKYGLRYTLFQNVSNGEPFEYLTDYETQYTETYKKGEVFHHQQQFEPRLGMAYLFNEEHSVKASYSRTTQFIQLASNSAAGSPLDVWFQASPNVKPQLSDQLSLGYFRNFSDNLYEASAEVYYKDLKNVIDFKDHAQLMGNEEIEKELRFGKGYAYGLELMLRKNTGRLNGWISYTFSRSMRQIDEINEGKEYRSPYDKPHNISIVANYELSKKWSLAANWVYATGMPVTYPTGRFQVEDTYVPIYSGRNEYRYPAYHRLDLSATCQLSKPNSRIKQELNFSIYNAYGKKNPWTIMFLQEDDQPDVSYAEMLYLFSFIPSITWNFTF